MKRMLIFFVVLFALLRTDLKQTDLQSLRKDTMTVHVSGAVGEEADIELPLYATVQDLLEQVDVEADADLSALNPGTVLKDHDYVAVPQKEEGMRQISINTADAEELCTLPGIGQSTAERIIAWREENGFFQTTEDLMKVSGIGAKKFEKIRDLICL